MINFQNFFETLYLTLSLTERHISGESQSIPQLNYYEIIHNIDISHNTIVKRSAESGDNANQLVQHLVSFRAINRDFNLLLTHNKDIISSQFNAYTIDANGRKKPIFVDLNEFYSGRVDGIEGSDVRAHIEPNGLMTASIHTGDETYEVEPIWRHLDNHNKNFSSMIVYKHKDVIHSTTSDNGSKHFCDFIKIEDNFTNDEFENDYRIRRKRQTYFDLNEITISDDMNGRGFKPTQTHCAMVLVADYSFYETMGNGDQKTTINYLIHIIDRVNNIFNNTEWTDDESKAGFKGMGFFIKEIQIHDQVTAHHSHYNNYNPHTSNPEREVRDLLEAFSLNKENSQFCLAHLFTHRTFKHSVLGLAYVASPRSGSVGGICSHNYLKGETTLYLNTGLTTTKNSFGQRIITREAALVTAHELGHNWGSEHDPDTPECSPKSESGGSYVMYTYSVSGYDHNNRFFSPCSKRSIRAVLVHKSHRCFSKPDKAYCGNSKVELDEECDEGLLVKGEDYRTGLCCDSRCKLIAGSDCSDRNSDCCASCRIRETGSVCKNRDDLNCKQESYCDGESDKCPEPSPLPDHTTCLDRGQCLAGKCNSYCAALGQSTCMCEHEIDACFRCCRPNIANGTCEPVLPRDGLPNGTPCKYGFCEKQRCEKAVQDFVERFWDVIEEIDINTFWNTMKDNIVLVVMFGSLLFWVPIALLVNAFDNKEKKEKMERRSASVGSDGSRVPTLRPQRTFNRRLTRPTVRDIIQSQNKVMYYPPGYP